MLPALRTSCEHTQVCRHPGVNGAGPHQAPGSTTAGRMGQSTGMVATPHEVAVIGGRRQFLRLRRMERCGDFLRPFPSSKPLNLPQPGEGCFEAAVVARRHRRASSCSQPLSTVKPRARGGSSFLLLFIPTLSDRICKQICYRIMRVRARTKAKKRQTGQNRYGEADEGGRSVDIGSRAWE